MLDVHAPEHGIHGIRDFFIHLLTITVGLLIALGLENLAEWRHHVHLKHQAEQTMRLEIRANQKDLQEVIAAVPRETEALKKIEALLIDISNGKAPTAKNLQTGIMQVTPENAAWNTASATGALNYMDYAEVQRFASAYNLQEKLDRFQDQALAPLLGIMAGFSSSDPAKMTQAQAQSMLQDVHLSLAHLFATQGLAKDVNKAYDEALKGE